MFKSLAHLSLCHCFMVLTCFSACSTNLGTKSSGDLHNLLKPHPCKWSQDDKDDSPGLLCVDLENGNVKPLSFPWIKLPQDMKTRWDTLPFNHLQSYARHLYFCLLSTHTPLVFGEIPSLAGLFPCSLQHNLGQSDAPAPVFESEGRDWPMVASHVAASWEDRPLAKLLAVELALVSITFFKIELMSYPIPF